MTPLGRDLVGPGAVAFRAAVVDFITRRSWSVVRHASFARWAHAQTTGATTPWFSLDPLFGAAEGVASARSDRMSRQHDPDHGFSLEAGATVAAPGVAACGVVDDAASSGTTLSAVISAFAASGSEVRTVLLCASSQGAKARVIGRNPGLHWREYLPGNWRVIHLRDGLDLLPLTGRATQYMPLAGVNRPIAQRTNVVLQQGNLWQVLMMDRGIADARESATDDALRRFRERFGRPMRARDVELLGETVCVPVPRGALLDADPGMEGPLETVTLNSTP